MIDDEKKKAKTFFSQLIPKYRFIEYQYLPYKKNLLLTDDVQQQLFPSCIYLQSCQDTLEDIETQTAIFDRKKIFPHLFSSSLWKSYKELSYSNV